MSLYFLSYFWVSLYIYIDCYFMYQFYYLFFVVDDSLKSNYINMYGRKTVIFIWKSNDCIHGSKVLNIHTPAYVLANWVVCNT